MSKIDAGRAWINRNVDHPVVSYDWSRGGILVPGGSTGGMIDEWRKVSENIRRRRSRHAVGSRMYNACEEALGLVEFITAAGQQGAIHGNWRPGHEILAQCAQIYERRTGRIDSLVQAVIRDSMDDAYTSEMFES